MANSTPVSPGDAQRLLQSGYTYVDVRSEPEFAQGHVPGAVNVPLQRVEGDRLVDNPEFLTVMCTAFRTTDPLIVGCRSGSRSRVALERLRSSGFIDVVELRHGFLGARDDFGRSLPGWVALGLPVATEESDLSQYESLVERCLGHGASAPAAPRQP